MRSILRVGILSALAALGSGCSGGPVDRLAEVARLGVNPDALAIERLEAAASDPEPAVRALAIATLGPMEPDRAAPIALKGLDDPSPAVRAASARVLGAGASKASTGPLAALARRDPSWDVRRRAATALGAIGGEQASKSLRDALLDPEVEVRVAAARALTAADPEGSVTACLFVLKTDDSWQVRLEAARLLARAKTAAAREALTEVAELDPNEFVRSEAARGVRP